MDRLSTSIEQASYVHDKPWERTELRPFADRNDVCIGFTQYSDVR